MHYTKKSSEVSDIISNLSEHRKKITISEISDVLQDRGIAIMMILLALPGAVPLPAPILGTIFGIPMLFMSFQLVLRRQKALLPKKISEKSISVGNLKATVKYLKKIEFFLHPRFKFMTSKWANQIFGIFCCIFAVLMAIPLPFTNTVPSLAILLIALGMLERDGIFVCIGSVIGFAWWYFIIASGNQLVAFVTDLI